MIVSYKASIQPKIVELFFHYKLYILFHLLFGFVVREIKSVKACIAFWVRVVLLERNFSNAEFLNMSVACL